MIETFEISTSEMCVRCKDIAGKAVRNEFEVLNMQDEAELIQDIADDYQRRGVSGPWCRRCGRLPVVSE